MEIRNKIIFWISTGFLSAMMIGSSVYYFVKTEEVIFEFFKLGYHSRIVIPLAILKILGIVAIVSNKSRLLREWAYFGFLIEFSLAIQAHLSIGDGEHAGAIAALALWLVSYVYGKKLRGT